MTSNSAITGEDVRRVAELANLELNSQEEQRLQRDLDAILHYVAQLNELDTAAIAPMAQVAEVPEAAEGGGGAGITQRDHRGKHGVPELGRRA